MHSRSKAIPGLSMLDHAMLYKTDIAQVRRWLKEPPAKLCRDTKCEIRNNSKGRSAKALAKMYNTTPSRIYLVTSDPENFAIPDQDIKMLFNNTMTDRSLESLADKLETSLSHVKRAYRSWLSDIVTWHRKEFTTAEVADLLGITMSKVTRLDRNAKTKGTYTKLEEEEWGRLLKAYNSKESITSLAKRFKISRAAIYGRLNREGLL